MLGYSPTKTQELLGNPDKSANPTASPPACAGLAGEHCTCFGCETKTGVVRILVNFQDRPMFSHII